MTTETTRAYETLKPRALDALVAERVMGQSVTLIGSHPHYMEDSTVYRAVRHYSTDPAAAFTVLEAMRAKGWSYVVNGWQERLSVTVFTNAAPTPVEGHYRSSDASMPRAAVIAALRALDAEVQ